MPVKIESEKLLEQKLVQNINKLGGFSIKLLAVHLTGLPDRLCLLPGGKIFFAEIKTTGKVPTKIQLLIHAKIRMLGFNVYIIDTNAKLTSMLISEGYE